MPLDDPCYCRKLHAFWKLGLFLQNIHCWRKRGRSLHLVHLLILSWLSRYCDARTIVTSALCHLKARHLEIIGRPG